MQADWMYISYAFIINCYVLAEMSLTDIEVKDLTWKSENRSAS